MLIESAIFHRHEGGRKIFRHFRELQAISDDSAAHAHSVAFLVGKGEGLRPVQRVQIGSLRDAGSDGDHHRNENNGKDDRHAERAGENAAGLAPIHGPHPGPKPV